MTTMYIKKKMRLRINNRKKDDQGHNKPTIHERMKNLKEYFKLHCNQRNEYKHNKYNFSPIVLPMMINILPTSFYFLLSQ